MANTTLTISMITRKALYVLENSLTFTKTVRRDLDDKFGVEGAKIGTVLNVRKPPRYVGRRGAALQLEDAQETQVAVTLNTQYGVDIEFSSQDLALSIDDFSDRFLKPAVSKIANDIDADGCLLYRKVYNTVGTPGTVPNAILTYLNAGVKMNHEACPRDGQRAMVIGPQMEATIIDALKGLFQQAAAIAEQYVQGQMGRVAGFTWYMDQNIVTHTVGAYAGTPLVNGASQTGASLITDGWTASITNALREGDVFTITSGTAVNAVNPQNRLSTAQARQFVVTADQDSSGAGAITIPISPSITTTGANQTVTASPDNNAALTVLGAASTESPQGMAHHKDAFVFVSADLPTPKGVDMAARISDKQLGISMRLIRDYDINSDKWPCRLDVLGGWAALRAELACRVAS